MLGWHVSVYRWGCMENGVYEEGKWLCSTEFGVTSGKFDALRTASFRQYGGGYPFVFQLYARDFPHETLELPSLSLPGDEIIHAVV